MPLGEVVVDVSILIQHVLVSLLPWLIAVLLAAGLGILWASVARSLFSRVSASPPRVRFIGGVRTLAAASVTVAAVAAPTVGGGGAGVLFFEGMRALDHGRVCGGFSAAVILALLIDLALGAAQMLFSWDEP